MATGRSRVLAMVLAGLALASLGRAVWVEREKQRVAKAYEEARRLATQLSEERERLNGQLVEAQQTVEGQAGAMASLRKELDGLQHRLTESLTELASLQREHVRLREEHGTLATQLSSTITENQQLQSRLSSLKELRLAIREVHWKISAQRLASWRARLQARREVDRDLTLAGNRGYVVREGKSTLSGSPRLHVHVLEPQSQ